MNSNECSHCYSKFIDFLLYWFRVSMPQNICILNIIVLITSVALQQMFIC